MGSSKALDEAEALSNEVSKMLGSFIQKLRSETKS